MIAGFCQRYLNSKRLREVLRELEFARHVQVYAGWSPEGEREVQALEKERDRLWPLVITIQYM